jgi:hypothetical protein
MRLTGSKIRLLIGHVSFLSGAAFFILAICTGAYEAVFLSKSLMSEGTVVSLIAGVADSNAGAGESTQTSLCPRVRYLTDTGIEEVFTSSACVFPAAFKVGQNVGVRYLKSAPQAAQTDSFGSRWGLCLGFAIASALLLPIGISVLYRLRSQGYPLDPIGFWD